MIWMLIGIVAFGFGLLYMNRMGEESSLYQGEESGIQNAVIPPIQTLPETNIQPIQEENQKAESLAKEIEIPEDDLSGIKADQEFDQELAKALQEIESRSEEKLEKAITAPVKQTKTLEKAKPIEQKSVPSAAISQTAFDVQLDPQVLSIIQQRIAATPHVGYRPVVQVMKNGNVNLTFLKL